MKNGKEKDEIGQSKEKIGKYEKWNIEKSQKNLGDWTTIKTEEKKMEKIETEEYTHNNREFRIKGEKL